MIEFLDELPTDSREYSDRTDYDEVAQALRDNPGDWGVVAVEGYTALLSQIEGGHIRAFLPAGHYKAAQVGKTYQGETPSGKRASRAPKIVARYVGPPPLEVDASPVSRAIARHFAESTLKREWATISLADRAVLVTAAEKAYGDVFPLIADELARA